MTFRLTCGSAIKTGLFTLTVAGMLATVIRAHAEGAAGLPPPNSNDWTITLGVEGRLMPEYEGASDFILRPLPIFRVRRAGTADRFRSPRDGASISLYDTGRFNAGPTLKFRLPRKESVSSDLRGLGDIDWAVEVGLFAEYWAYDWLRMRAELRQGMGGHRGLVGDLSADVVVPVAPKLTLSGGPRATIASDKATDPYFGITATQAAASGLPVYDAGGGLRSVGAGAQAKYAFTPRWAGHMFIEYERLTGDAADSPLVSLRGSRDQIQLGIGATYSFNVPGLW